MGGMSAQCRVVWIYISACRTKERRPTRPLHLDHLSRDGPRSCGASALAGVVRQAGLCRLAARSPSPTNCATSAQARARSRSLRRGFRPTLLYTATPIDY